jgi:hypothetical protein
MDRRTGSQDGSGSPRAEAHLARLSAAPLATAAATAQDGASGAVNAAVRVKPLAPDAAALLSVGEAAWPAHCRHDPTAAHHGGVYA